jgi:hypothetical protein
MQRQFACVLVALLSAGAARAQDRRPAPRPAPAQADKPPPLSKEDAELIKELALLEQLDLVKNLELFQEDKRAEASEPQRQP